jgi:hypothetical protein
VSKPTSPASRLHALLTAFRRNRNKELRSFDVWLVVLRTPADSTFYTRFAELGALFREVERSVEQLPESDRDLYLEELKNLEKIMEPTEVARAWKDAAAHITETGLLRLRFLAAALEKLPTAEQLVPSERIAELINELSSLERELLHVEDIPAELREFLHFHLQSMHGALVHYHVRGAKGLRDTLNMAVGATLRNMKLVQEHNRPDGLVARCLRALLRLDAIVSTALKVLSLKEASDKVGLGRLLAPGD